MIMKHLLTISKYSSFGSVRYLKKVANKHGFESIEYRTAMKMQAHILSSGPHVINLFMLNSA